MAYNAQLQKHAGLVSLHNLHLTNIMYFAKTSLTQKYITNEVAQNWY